MSVKIDKNKWSASSRRSSDYTLYLKNATCYTESIGYRCKKCFSHCVFTPEEQKEAFEVDKKIIHYVPSLCANCQKDYEKICQKAEEFQREYNCDKELYSSNEQYIKEWLQLVREKNSYGKSVDVNAERMLEKILRKVPS